MHCIVRAGPELGQGHCGCGRTGWTRCAQGEVTVWCVVCGLWRVVCCVRWAGGRDERSSRKMQTSPVEQREPARATGVGASARNRRRARWRNRWRRKP